VLFIIWHATALAQISTGVSTYALQRKQLELKQHSLLYRIINAIDIRIHAGLGAGYFLSQFDPINPTYTPYAIRDRFSLSISINISKILDNSTYKIKQLELQQLQQEFIRQQKENELKQKITQEKIALLKEKIKVQSQIIELNEIYFKQNKISADKLLEEKIKLLELQLQLKELETSTGVSSYAP
jgi:hypothetical protein